MSTRAVLPFQNMSGNPGQEYFADGMVEDIITALSRGQKRKGRLAESPFYPGRTDINEWRLDVRKVPIVLKKSFAGDGRKF